MCEPVLQYCPVYNVECNDNRKQLSAKSAINKLKGSISNFQGEINVFARENNDIVWNDNFDGIKDRD